MPSPRAASTRGRRTVRSDTPSSAPNCDRHRVRVGHPPREHRRRSRSVAGSRPAAQQVSQSSGADHLVTQALVQQQLRRPRASLPGAGVSSHSRSAQRAQPGPHRSRGGTCPTSRRTLGRCCAGSWPRPAPVAVGGSVQPPPTAARRSALSMTGEKVPEPVRHRRTAVRTTAGSRPRRRHLPRGRNPGGQHAEHPRRVNPGPGTQPDAQVLLGPEVTPDSVPVDPRRPGVHASTRNLVVRPPTGCAPRRPSRAPSTVDSRQKGLDPCTWTVPALSPTS